MSGQLPASHACFDMHEPFEVGPARQGSLPVHTAAAVHTKSNKPGMGSSKQTRGPFEGKNAYLTALLLCTW